jgi:NAD(P)-dependent dehydrogenase (short-subunit alcohol dehydrogenase family)
MEIREIFSPTALRDTVTVVTGAGRGLGKSLALALAQAGSDLVLVARHQEEIDRTAREIDDIGVNTLTVAADLTRQDEISRMIQTVLSEFGRIDVLVNNAGQNGSYVHHKFEDIPEDEWDSMMRTNVTGLVLVTQAVGRTMLARGKGKVINIASSMGVRSAPERLCYSVSKAAVIQLTRALALEWALRGVTVNCIAPGSLDVRSPDRHPERTDETWLKSIEERKKRIPAGHLGNLEDVGPAVVYFASRASDYATGTTIFIDGGMSL